MAYCVHCGVKLGEGEKRCPLCGTAVLDPAERGEEALAKPRAYPVKIPEQELKRSRNYLVSMAALILLTPALLCLVIDLLATRTVTWSGYASTALVLLFVAVAVPLLLSRGQAYATVGVSFLCLNAYLFLVEGLSNSGPWFFPIALPALTLFTGMALLIILLYKKGKLNKLTLLASAFVAAAAECVAIEGLRLQSLGAPILFTWSPFVLAPCLFIAFSLFFINSNRAVREEVRRRVHF